MTSMENHSNKAPIHIGIVIDGRDRQAKQWCKWLLDQLQREMESLFPRFSWRFSSINRHDFPRQTPLDPLSLLEFGSDIKIECGFDYVIVLSSLPLRARFAQGINAVPSNVLETTAIGLARILELESTDRQQKAILALVKHCLGHMWGLDHNDDSVMRPRKFWTGDPPLDWSREELSKINKHLQEIADPRIEETSNTKSKVKFYLKVLTMEGPAILKDVLLSRSALLMFFHLGRSTAATAVSIIFLFLSAEAWEMGAAVDSGWLDLLFATVIIVAALSLYFGQNLQVIGRSDRMKEQAVRSKVVVFTTLLVGMASFWINLFIISYFVIKILPQDVLAGWAGIKGQVFPALHFSKLMATFGVLASAVGGNLEKEQDIKALLVYSEET